MNMSTYHNLRVDVWLAFVHLVVLT